MTNLAVAIAALAWAGLVSVTLLWASGQADWRRFATGLTLSLSLCLAGLLAGVAWIPN